MVIGSSCAGQGRQEFSVRDTYIRGPIAIVGPADFDNLICPLECKKMCLLAVNRVRPYPG